MITTEGQSIGLGMKSYGDREERRSGSVSVDGGGRREGREPGFWELNSYGYSSLNNYLVGNAVFTLSLPILNMSLGISPTLIGLALMARTLVDAISDPLMAHVSDNAKTRWGRRRPFVLIGGILTAVCAFLVWSFPRGWSDGQIVLYFGIAISLLAVAQTIFSVPYYALGIELSPSYHGRTRVAVYRSIWEKVTNLISPWFYPFCLLAVFTDALQGVRTLVLISICFSIPGVVLTFMKTRERTGRLPKRRVGFYSSVRKTVRSVHFLRITGIYVILLFSFGLFGNFGIYLTNYYVYEGALAEGSVFFSVVNSLGFLLSLASLPLVSYLSKRIQKHNTLIVALALMIIGSLLHYFVMVPGKPYFMLILPFFYSLGVSCIFTILPSLQADIVDVDELESGERREGMFGAAASLMMKGSHAVAVGLSGFLIDWSGFDAEAKGLQSEQALHRMMSLNAFGQAGLLILGLLLLWRYPLTEGRMGRIRRKLEERRGTF